jgi:hypothetical protein
LVADVVLDQSMMRWALHANALVTVGDLRNVSCVRQDLMLIRLTSLS